MKQLKVGDRIRDNDPRMLRRVLTIERLWFPLSGDGAKVICNDAVGRPFSILMRRVYMDGKTRRTGFSLVEPDNSQGAAISEPKAAAK